MTRRTNCARGANSSWFRNVTKIGTLFVADSVCNRRKHEPNRTHFNLSMHANNASHSV